MKIRKIIPYMLLFLIVLFMSLGGCKSLPPEDEAEKEDDEINMEPEEETTNEKESKDIEYTVIRESECFELPDKIIIYDKGNSIIIEKDAELYDTILYLMDKRLKKVKDFEISGYLIMDEDVDIKNTAIAVEFIYNKEKQTTYGKERKNYFRILFPLISLPHGAEDELIFFGDNKHYYSPAIKVPKPDKKLINLIKEEINK